MLQEMTGVILEAAGVLSGTLNEKQPPSTAWQTIRDLEHKGDAIVRDLHDLLVASPTDSANRDALKALAGYLDDVLDAIEDVAAHLAIHRVRRPHSVAREMCATVMECAHELHEAMGRSRSMHDVFPHTRSLNRLESQADDLMHKAVEVLFQKRASAREIINIMIWKDVCGMLEDATDRCEDVADILETLVIESGAEDQLAAGGLVMDVARHAVTIKGKEVSLTAKEFDLLHLLLRRLGKVVRRQRLLGEVWGGDYFGDTRTLDTHVAWLRKKIEPDGGVRIVAVRGIGYRLDLSS